MRLVLVATLIALCLQLAHSADFASVMNGNWSQPLTWGGTSIPGSGDSVSIRHSVNVDITTASADSVYIDATRTLFLFADSFLTADALNINGSVTGNGALRVRALSLVSSVSQLRLTGAGSLIEITESAQNPLERNLEAQTIRLLAATSLMRVTGVVQTNRIGALELPQGAALQASSVGSLVHLGGRLNLFGRTLSVHRGNFALVGSALLGGGGLIQSTGDSDGNVLIQPSSSTTTLESSVFFGVGTTATVAAGKTLNVRNDQSVQFHHVNVQGEISGTNVTVRVVGDLTVAGSTGSIVLGGGGSLLDLQGDINNGNDSDLEADEVRLSGAASRSVNGLVQSDKQSVLSVVGDLTLVNGGSGVRLGGCLALQGQRLTVLGGHVALVGNEIRGGTLRATDANAQIQIATTSNNYVIAGPEQVVLQAAGGVQVPANRRLDASAQSLRVIGGLFLDGGVIGSNAQVQIDNQLALLSATASVSLTGGSSLLVLGGSILNPLNLVLTADVVRLAGASGAAREISGTVQTQRSNVLDLAGAQNLVPASDVNGAPIRLGGLISLNGFAVRLTNSGSSSSELHLVGGGANGVGSVTTVGGGNIVVNPASTTWALGTAGQLTLSPASGARAVVTVAKVLSVGTDAVVSVTGAGLLLDGGDVTGAGTVRVSSLELRSNAGADGEVRLDSSRGVLDLLGDVYNPANLALTAGAIRLTGNFLRTVVGTVQTSSSGALVLACPTTLSQASSNVVLGGVLQLNGQTLNVETPAVTISSGSIRGSGVIRFAEGCDCAVPVTVTLSPTSSTEIRDQVVFQNVLLRVAASKTVNINAGSVMRVAGAKGSLTVEGRISGSGRLVVHNAVVEATGRISLSGGSAAVEAATTIVNNSPNVVSPTPIAPVVVPATECEDAACKAAAVVDLRRQIRALTASVRAGSIVGTTCASGLCPGWSGNFTSFGC